MPKKSSAHYQREFRRRLREQGLVKKEVWIKPENAKLLVSVEKKLRDSLLSASHFLSTSFEEITMEVERRHWTTKSLGVALKGHELVKNNKVAIEVIDGVDPALHLIAFEYGDLPIFLTVSGDQIIAEAVLWSEDDVVDKAAFNEAVLKTHKYFPLSTISLDTLDDGTSYYHMFGALSAASTINDVIFELEALANNVIQATEAYSEFLSFPVEVSA